MNPKYSTYHFLVVKNAWIYLVLAYILMATGCRPGELSNIREYQQYLAEPDNGLVKEKRVGDIKLQARYLPLDYWVYQDLDEEEGLAASIDIDSLRRRYESSLSFMLTIGPAEGASFDITRVGLPDYETYSERLHELNFNMKDRLHLEAGEMKYTPVLTEMESVYGLKEHRNFIVVFPAGEELVKGLPKEDCTLVFTDDIFRTGISRFYFRKRDLERIPAFKF